MKSSYTLPLEAGNIYIVPVLRNRLVFASLVRRALDQLDEAQPWSGRDDLICVTLPPSVREGMLDAIERLPIVTQVLARDGESTAREVFSISPADAFVEAVRSAGDRGGAVAFVDAEVQPGNLIRSPCERHPDWLDDAFVDILGVDRYYREVRDILALPPFRAEPVDTWREAQVLQNVRELQPLWRRVLLVCDMSLVGHIGECLGAPDTGRTRMPDQGGPSAYVAQRHLNITVLLNVLDDYPRLVEVFNERRNWSGKSFDKREVLLEEIYDFLRGVRDIPISTRQVKAFTTFLNNLTVYGRRRCPVASALFVAMNSCFGKALAERLHCHLTSYCDQIAVERVRPRALSSTDSFKYTLDVRHSAAGFRTRECNPIAPQFVITPAVPPLPPKSTGASREFEWPAQNRIFKQAHQKVRLVTQDYRPVRRITKFTGSIEAGVDTRRTLRSLYGGKTTLYVKAAGRCPEPLNLQHEPVLWLPTTDFTETMFFVQSGHFKLEQEFKELGPRQEGLSFYISEMEFLRRPDHLDEIELFADTRHSVKVWGARRLAWLTFGFQYGSEEEARLHYDEERRRMGHNVAFEARVPDHQQFAHPYEYGCVHRDLLAYAPIHEASWVELAVLTAFKYAHKAVVVVLPNGASMPPEILRNPMCRGKHLHYVSFNKFTHTERDRLTTHYRIGDESQKGNSSAYYESLMARF